MIMMVILVIMMVVMIIIMRIILIDMRMMVVMVLVTPEMVQNLHFCRTHGATLAVEIPFEESGSM